MNGRDSRCMVKRVSAMADVVEVFFDRIHVVEAVWGMLAGVFMRRVRVQRSDTPASPAGTSWSVPYLIDQLCEVCEWTPLAYVVSHRDRRHEGGPEGDVQSHMCRSRVSWSVFHIGGFSFTFYTSRECRRLYSLTPSRLPSGRYSKHQEVEMSGLSINLNINVLRHNICLSQFLLQHQNKLIQQ